MQSDSGRFWDTIFPDQIELGYFASEFWGNNYSTVLVVSGRKTASQRRTGMFDLSLGQFGTHPSGTHSKKMSLGYNNDGVSMGRD